MPTYDSALRYPGGKASLFDFLNQVIEINGIGDCTYVEPYAGGAGAALRLLFKERVSNIVLNDGDPAIAAFWNSVIQWPAEFIRKLKSVPVTVEEWKRQRRMVFSEKGHVDELDLGFAAFYLNRCNWSGILKARPIGGLSQKGKWKINARFNKKGLAEKIEKIAEYGERIQVTNMDAEKLLNQLPDLDGIVPSKCLVYCDPPYFLKGQTLYRYYYDYENHLSLAKTLKSETRYHWLLSYDDAPEIHAMYREIARNVFNLNYFVNSLKLGRELIMSSPGCELPESFIVHSKDKSLTVTQPDRKAS